MIIDASVVLSAFLPDEEQTKALSLIQDYVFGQVILSAPTLLVYEVTNAVRQAVRRERIIDTQAEQILLAFDKLQIVVKPVSWRNMLRFAQRFDRSAYDAAYLALADQTHQPFITGDKRLYNAVCSELEWVKWIGDYQGRIR